MRVETKIKASISVSLSLLACHSWAAQDALDDATSGIKALPPMVVKDKQINSATVTNNSQPGGIGHVTRLDLEDVSASITRLDDVLIDAGLMTADANTSLGLAAGLNARGFSVLQQGSTTLSASKVFLNGHPDIAWRFARDPATVSKVNVMSGHDATFLGSGSPGASINFISKQPEGYEFRRINLGLGSNSAKRFMVDAETHLGGMQVRGVIAVQRDDFSAEKVKDERHVGLLSAKLPTDWGDFRVDAEYHQLKMPYVFGTAYAGNRFWLDHSYVDPRAAADRQYARGGLYWQKKTEGGLTWSAYSQTVRSTRDELLLGWYDIKNAAKLNGYYRLIDEVNHQTDNGIKLEGQTATGAVQHDWAVTAQQHSQKRAFSGPQNISGFVLDLESPVFPENLSKLKLSDRYAFETYQENGVAVSDKMNYGDWEMRLGLRRSNMQFDRTTSPVNPQLTVAQIQHTSAAWGVGYKMNDAQRLWLSNTQSFLPNRGHLRSGEFLPPSQGRQIELGWAYKADKQAFSASVFSIKQSHLPAVDPLDKDAFILIGRNTSQGIELNATLQSDSVKWGAAATFLKARVSQATDASQGVYLPGTPSAYGAVYGTVRVGAGYEGTARVIFASSRPGDDKASFKAPGYGILNLSVAAPASGSVRWGLALSNALDKSYVRAISSADNVWQGSRRTFKVWLELSYF